MRPIRVMCAAVALAVFWTAQAAPQAEAADVTLQMGVTSGYGYGSYAVVGHPYRHWGHGPHCRCGCHGWPVYRYPPVVVPYPVYPRVYPGYRYYGYPRRGIYYGGRGFGISIGF